MNSLPLTGRRVLVTRAAHQAGRLSKGLRALGAEPVEVPVLEIRPPESFEPLDAAIREMNSYNWLILTSVNAVQALAERASFWGISLINLAFPPVAAIGKSTAEAACKFGLNVSLIPESYVAESLAEGLLANRVSGQRILLARAAIARDVIPDALRSVGAKVDVVDAYRNVLPEAAPEMLRSAVAARLDAVAFTSSSSATHLAEAAAKAGVVWPFAKVAAISIGPITSQTLRDLGWSPAAEADPSDIPGLIAAVQRVI